MTDTYQKGDRIFAEFVGIVDEAQPSGPFGTTRVRTEGGCVHYLFLCDDTAVRPAPDKNWPPVPGDVWERRTDGERFIARTRDGATVLSAVDPDTGELHNMPVPRIYTGAELYFRLVLRSAGRP